MFLEFRKTESQFAFDRDEQFKNNFAKVILLIDVTIMNLEAAYFKIVVTHYPPLEEVATVYFRPEKAPTETEQKYPAYSAEALKARLLKYEKVQKAYDELFKKAKKTRRELKKQYKGEFYTIYLLKKCNFSD